MLRIVAKERYKSENCRMHTSVCDSTTQLYPVVVYHSEAAIARVKDNAHFEDHVYSEDLDICANF